MHTVEQQARLDSAVKVPKFSIFVLSLLAASRNSRTALRNISRLYMGERKRRQTFQSLGSKRNDLASYPAGSDGDTIYQDGIDDNGCNSGLLMGGSRLAAKAPDQRRPVGVRGWTKVI